MSHDRERQTGAIVVRDALASDDGSVGELLVAAYMTQYARKTLGRSAM